MSITQANRLGGIAATLPDPADVAREILIGSAPRRHLTLVDVLTCEHCDGEIHGTPAPGGVCTSCWEESA